MLLESLELVDLILRLLLEVLHVVVDVSLDLLLLVQPYALGLHRRARVVSKPLVQPLPLLVVRCISL